MWGGVSIFSRRVAADTAAPLEKRCVALCSPLGTRDSHGCSPTRSPGNQVVGSRTWMRMVFHTVACVESHSSSFDSHTVFECSPASSAQTLGLHTDSFQGGTERKVVTLDNHHPTLNFPDWSKFKHLQSWELKFIISQLRGRRTVIGIQCWKWLGSGVWRSWEKKKPPRNRTFWFFSLWELCASNFNATDYRGFN